MQYQVYTFLVGTDGRHTALSFIRLVLTGIAHRPLIHKFSPSSWTFSQPSHNQLVSFHFSTRTSFRCNIIMLLQTCVNCSCSSKSFDLKPEGHDLDHPCLVSFLCNHCNMPWFICDGLCIQCGSGTRRNSQCLSCSHAYLTSSWGLCLLQIQGPEPPLLFLRLQIFFKTNI